jgi:transposase
VQAKREAFIALQPQFDGQRLIFLDESGFRLGSPPHYGWAPVGEKSPGRVVHGDWKSMTMIGALGLGGFKGFMTIDDATSTEVFREFIRQQLVPQLRIGDVVVMDNLNVHKDATVAMLLQQAGVEVVFLPPYSPEFNPIEKAWAKMKDLLRRANTLTRDAFDAAVSAAMASIDLDDILAWYRYAGYQVTSN